MHDGHLYVLFGEIYRKPSRIIDLQAIKTSAKEKYEEFNEVFRTHLLYNRGDS